MTDLLVLVASVALVAASAFFVAVEFALLAARRHRLADEAASSAAARAALRSASELSLLLAGSQLGITVCTLALGAVTKPAVHHWLTPLLTGWGVPAWVADVLGFVVALLVVTFVHLVVGEMAPKSWAIAHPERSARMLARPMRGFIWLTRPLLVALNDAANRCLRRVGVDPVDETLTGRDPQTLRHLVEHSGRAGTLASRESAQLSRVLQLADLTLADVVRADASPVAVAVGATAGDVQEASRRSGHLRILLSAPDGRAEAVVHVRDTLDLPPQSPVAPVSRPVHLERADAPVYSVLARMRATSSHLVVVRDGGTDRGVVTLTDLLTRLLPPSEREKPVIL